MAKNRHSRRRPPPKMAAGGSFNVPLGDDGEEGPEEVDIPEDPEAAIGDTVENADGSAEVTLDEGRAVRESPEFTENLAEVLSPEFIGSLGREYVELAEQDIEARRERDHQYAEGIKRSGLTGTSQSDTGGADFNGASRVVHPMLSQAAIEFESRAIKELFPANGPCKTQIVGEQTEAKLDKAERKKTFMNWQATTQIEENRSVYERVLSQVPMAGAAYKRWWYDPELKRNRTEAVFLDDIFTPYGDSDFYTASRVTYRQRIIRNEYDRRVRTGLYRDLNLGEASLMSSMTDESRAQKASDRVEGVDPDASSYNEDGLRLIYQIDVVLDVEEDDFSVGPAPYVLHIDQDSESVLGLYRNWKEDDDKCRKKHHMSEWNFIPWREGPALGFTHIIGSLSVAGTGALRALMDAAQIENFPGAMVLEGAKAAGQNVQVSATELVPIKAPDGDMSPDIRKLVMQMPFKGPSQTLFTLLEWITQRAEGVVATASEKIAEGGADMPVGTAMALIEHGSANFRAIHARLHESMKRDLEIQHRLDAEFMEDEETVEELGELVVYRADFEGPMDIVPVSDPNIFSEAQRYAQMQAMLQLKTDPVFAPFFKPDQLLGRILRLMNIPDIEGITNLPKEPKQLSATEENYVLSMNERPLKVYASDDDVKHLKMHVMFATSPMFGANPLVAGGIIQPMLAHCKEHMMALYKKHVSAATEAVRFSYRKMNIPIDETNDDEVAMQGAAQAEQLLAQELSPLVMPGLEKMQQMAQALAPKPPVSPDVAATLASQEKIEGMRLQAKAAETKSNNDFNAMKAQADAALQKMTDSSTERLAKLGSTIELIKQQQDIGGKQVLIDLQGQQAEQLAVLNAALTTLTDALAPPKPAPGAVGPDGEPIPAADGAAPAGGESASTSIAADSPLVGGIKEVLASAIQEMLASQGGSNADAIASNVAAMLQQEHESNAAAFAQLSQGLQNLAGERESEIFIGPDGKKRARSYYPAQRASQQPQPQLPQE